MMVVLRVIAILLGLGVIVSAAFWILTGERRWFDRSILLVKVSIGVGLVFFGVLAAQRLMS